MDIGDLLSNPVFIVALAAVMRAALAWQRELSWPEYRTLHGGKRLLFPVLQRTRASGIVSFVNQKRGRDDAEYIATVPGGVKDVAGELRDAGGTLHLISSIKRRPEGRGDTLSGAHVVWNHGADQTEAYLFRNDGPHGVDVYSHFEPSPETPAEHVDASNQQDGDPRGVVRDALGL